MSAQTAPAHQHGAEPITPVIIKTGGDGDPEHKKRPGHLVTIDSPMPFIETVAGPTWASSQSQKKGRIVELTITDGLTPPISYKVSSRNKLTSVTVEFGSARLMAMESGIADIGDVLLLLISPEIPFTAGKRDWHLSKASFPQKITRVTLMEGDRRAFHYEFLSEDATVHLSFDLN
jgi:hypothetical protein